MKKLWNPKNEFAGYSSQKISISKTFGGNRKRILCYERNYEVLNEEQLFQLLSDAKKNEWTTLDLSNCGIKQLPDELWDIKSLKVLFLGNWLFNENTLNTFNEIPEKIKELENLEAISFCNIKNLKIPNALKQLPKLTYLDCFGCNFKKIPTNLINRNIKAIGIDCKNIEQVTQICKFKKLEELFLTGSQIDKLPIEIGNLKNLRTLFLHNSQVNAIPESLLNLKRLRTFDITNTPLEKQLPEEMRKQNAYDLISYITKQQNQQDLYFFNESKMVIVGQGNVGKSCLLERITNDKYEDKESTEGIDVKKWIYNKNNKQYKLNIWDFGGQEIYHSTHQFFLTSRSLYIFVWDARAEEEYGRIDYWLKTIESFAEDSPIIICINKCDKNTTRINRIDFKEYQEKYPQIVSILDISCKDNINISTLRTTIKKAASNLQITKEKWLKSWYDIRNEIEILRNSEKYISYEKYLNLCKKYDVEIEEAKSLSKYLHDLGIILHYQDDHFLKSIVILSPEWATSAVYKILDSQENILKGKNGVLFLKDLPKIWKDYNIYPEDKHILLLKIMEKFQLCFELNEESYLVAELLENESIKCPKGWNFDSNSCIGMIYQYDFMPAGIMTRFIVKVHEYIANANGKDLCWRKGVYLKHKSAYARVVMKDTISEKRIEVKINKKDDSVHQRELLYIIRTALNEINANFKKINVKEYVPCNCSPNCNFKFSYENLCNALDQKIEDIQCHNSFLQVSILKLLEGIDIMKHETSSPYTISIEANPTIQNHISVSNTSEQTTVVNFKEIQKNIMDLQGDISEIISDIKDEISKENQDEINSKIERIYEDLEVINGMKTPEEVVKSGKLNKLKRFLIDFSNKDSDIRKSLSGAKNIVSLISALAIKFNNLAEKLGIDLLPL